MSEHDFARMRRSMVESQLRTSGVNETSIVSIMGKVPREAFVEPAHRAIAYMDRPLYFAGEVSRTRALNPPLALGRMLTEARPEASDKVLLIGAGTGYAAAVLGGLVDNVVAVENMPELARQARENLSGQANVEIVEGELTAGHPAGAPYDLILIDGAVEHVPEAIWSQLREGGRLVCGIYGDGVPRLAIGRRSEGGFGLRSFTDYEVPKLPGFEKEKGFTF